MKFVMTWRSFLNMLAYKADLYGKEFLTIDPKYTTQRCHACAQTMEVLGMAIYQFEYHTFLHHSQTCGRW